VTDTSNLAHALQHDAAPGRGDREGIPSESSSVHYRRDLVGQQCSHCSSPVGRVRSPPTIERRAVERSSSAGRQMVSDQNLFASEGSVVGGWRTKLKKGQAFLHQRFQAKERLIFYILSETRSIFGRTSRTDSRVQRSFSVRTAQREGRDPLR
jgi:hypothetical protein